MEHDEGVTTRHLRQLTPQCFDKASRDLDRNRIQGTSISHRCSAHYIEPGWSLWPLYADVYLDFAPVSLVPSSRSSTRIYRLHSRLAELVLRRCRLVASQLHSFISVYIALASLGMFLHRSRRSDLHSAAASCMELLVRLRQGVQEVFWPIHPSSCHLLLPPALAWWWRR